MVVDKVEGDFVDYRVKIRPDLTVEEIVKMQLEAVQKATALTWEIYKARVEEGEREADARHVFNEKFLLSDASSDRKKEADARKTPEVRAAENLHFAAQARRKYLEERKQDYLNNHYSLRAMLEDKSKERIWGA